MPRGSVYLMFAKIKETERRRHRIPTLLFLVSRATHDVSACMREARSSSNLREVWVSSDPSVIRASGSD